MKEIWVATDFYDDTLVNGQGYSAKQLRDLMAYSKALGATTATWIVDDMWSFYDIAPDGRDVLAEAIEAAHAEGLTFHAVYKPFEGGLDNIELPHTAPRPAGAVFWEDLRGILPITRPFVAAHPELCMQRWPGDEDPGGALAAIRLIKDDDIPLKLKAEDLSIWTSDVNGRFQRYDRPFTLTQRSGWEPTYPMGRTCRSVLIQNLSISPEQRYVEVRLHEGALNGQTFRNEYPYLVELINDRGKTIPGTLALAEPPREQYVRHLARPVMRELVRYARMPEVRAFLDDDRAIAEHASEMRAYGRATSNRSYALDETRRISIARGKIPRLSAMLNPVYPEAREHWMEAVRFCLDRGADAINIRSSKHGLLQENWAYGYNPPVMEALGGEVDTSRARRVIGDAFTLFLREARELVHGRGRKLGVHLMTNFLRPRDESCDNPLEYMDSQWQTWVSEIADFATFRGAFGYRPETVRFAVDRFAEACRSANIPLVYQSHRRYYTRQNPLAFHPDRIACLRQEMAYALGHPGVSGYEFYETAGFTKIDEQNVLQGNSQFRDLATEFGC